MARKRLTEIFPFLIPIRTWQRNLFYFIKMRFDGNKYAKILAEELLPYEIVMEKTKMINEDSGYDIQYQINKVDNLKITSKTMNKLIIHPGETFSFCLLAKNYKKYGKYKDGLVLINNKIVAKNGGGLCQLSNILYYSFLQTPLTIVERHGHHVKSLPNSDKDALEGVDATVSSGWLDLKVKNETQNNYQIILDFDDTYMYAKILCDKDSSVKATILNENFHYFKKDNKIYESVDVCKEITDKEERKVIEKKKLYSEVVEVTYKLPSNVKIEEEEANEEN